MGNDGTGRRSFRDLFAERQIHIRSGDESRYVVVSRPLQTGVAVGFLALLTLLATASYNAISKHLELTAQHRELAEQVAASAAQAERSAGELATLQQRNEAARREIEQLTAALDQARAERMEAIGASREAGAKAAELEAAFVATTQERRRPSGELAETRTSGGSGSAPGSADTENLRAEITVLRAELARVNREAQALRRTASEARQALSMLQGDASREAALQARPASSGTPPWQLAVGAAPSGEAIRRLQQDLVDARATVAGLIADLEALKGTGNDSAPGAAAELASLEEQLGSAHRRAAQLGASLAARQPAAAGDAPAAPPAAPAGAPADGTPLPSPPAPR